MHALIAFIATAEPMTNPADVWYSPGVIGFIATFGVAGAAIALIFDMTRRVRRVRYRSEIQDKLEAERSAAKGTSATKPAAKRAAPAPRPKPERPAAPAKPKRD
jgi:hypothetical protein